MRHYYKLILLFVYAFSIHVLHAASLTSTQNGAWNDGRTWGGSLVSSPLPTAHDVVTIANGTTVTANDNVYSAAENLIVNGILEVGATNLTIGGDNLQIGVDAVRNSYCIVNGTGTLKIAGDWGHQFKVYGYIKLNTGSSFDMSSGVIMIDGCGYTAPLSVPADIPLLDVTDATNFSTTGGQIVLFNPHYFTGSLSIKGAKTFYSVSFGNNLTLSNFACRNTTDFVVAENADKPIFKSIRLAYVPHPNYQNRVVINNLVLPETLEIIMGVLVGTTTKVASNVFFGTDAWIEGNVECNGFGQQNITTYTGATSALIKGNLVVNNPARVHLGLNLAIQNGTVQFLQGKLDVSDKTLSLPSAPTGATATNYIITRNQSGYTGTLLIKNITDAQLFPVGTETDYLPVTLAASNGDFSVSAHPLSIGAGTTFFINAQWDINRVSGTSAAQIAAQWNAANESTDFTSYRQNARLHHYNGTVWEPLSTQLTTLTPNAFFKGTAANITHFSAFTMLSTSAVLPIDWLSFTASMEKESNRLQWATAAEVNTAYFDIERSEKGVYFEKIGTVKAQDKATTYQFTDNTPLSIAYYRVRSIDNDAKEALSKVVAVTRKATGSLTVYPSIATNYLNIETNLTDNFSIINALGQVIRAGKISHYVDISTLPIGVYIFKVGQTQAKFVKQ